MDNGGAALGDNDFLLCRSLLRRRMLLMLYVCMYLPSSWSFRFHMNMNYSMEAWEFAEVEIRWGPGRVGVSSIRSVKQGIRFR